jgi:heat shock protein HspQ
LNSHIHENITSGLKKELGLIIDGQPSLEQQFHRVPTTEKPRSKNGWYRIFLNTHKGKEYQACVAGDWLTGRKETYKGYEDSDISKGELKKWKAEQDVFIYIRTQSLSSGYRGA